jgi:hypothetical protein
MTRFQKLWQFTGYAVLALGAVAVGANRAAADHYPPARPAICRPYHYETVVTYETRYEPVIRYVTRYDHCGRAYQVAVRDTRPVRVPVKRVVKVWD